jgi:hypothetical protein
VIVWTTINWRLLLSISFYLCLACCSWNWYVKFLEASNFQLNISFTPLSCYFRLSGIVSFNFDFFSLFFFLKHLFSWIFAGSCRREIQTLCQRIQIIMWCSRLSLSTRLQLNSSLLVATFFLMEAAIMEKRCTISCTYIFFTIL